MACRKCGSDWVTPRGRDCNRCPHCDKGKLFEARRAGRWIEPKQEKQCVNCSNTFTAVGVKDIKQRILCDRPECRKEHRKANKERRESGVFIGPRPSAEKKQNRFCKRCGKGPLNRNQKEYCGRSCFFAARASGEQPWDRTNTKKAYWHVGGPYAGAPSARLVALISKAHIAIQCAGNALFKLAEKELARPKCETCGCPCKDGASRFCSRRCNKQWRGLRPCELCGTSVQDANAYSKCRCKVCKTKEKTKANRRQKQKYGRNHRQRARHHGVKYVSIPVREIYERDGWTCQICNRRCRRFFLVSKRDGRPHPRSPTIDHIRSMAEGGNHERSNVQLACFECNTKKGAASRGQLRLALA